MKRNIVVFMALTLILFMMLGACKKKSSQATPDALANTATIKETTSITVTATGTLSATVTRTSTITATATPTATVTNTTTPAVVIFADANLEAKVRTAIAKPSGNIRSTDLLGLTYLDASLSSITNLGGSGSGDSVFLTNNSLSAQCLIDAAALGATYGATVTY